MRPCPSSVLFLLVVILLGTISLLSGCGKKGPLYLPDEKAAVAVSPSTPEP